MFQLFKKKETEAVKIELPELEVDGDKIIISSPMEGSVVPCTEIRDMTFKLEMLGKGVAIIPTVGKVYAPADGKIEMVMDSLHAFSMTTIDGVEVMVHVGIDTVAFKGKHFKSHVKEGMMVKRGDLLLEFDLKAIEESGYGEITPIIIYNSENYTEIEKMIGKEIKVGETLMKLTKAAI